jgi:deoxyribonuclease V
MDIDTIFPWTSDIDEAIQLQDNLRERLMLSWDDRTVKMIAGVDVSSTEASVYAAIDVCRYPELTRVSTFTGEAPQAFPYIPGLLAFRAGPAILAAWKKVTLKPDLILIHGHGTAHPRGLGLASHVGLWLNLPTIGIARTRLYGSHAETGPDIGEWSELLDEGDLKRVIGAVLRTQVNIKPVYVSPGHLIDLQHAIRFVQASCRKYRMPEPIRAAHNFAVREQRHVTVKFRLE